MRVALLFLLVACGGHKKAVVGEGAPGGGGNTGTGSGSDGHDMPFEDPAGGCKADPGEPMGGNCEKGPKGWPVDGDLQVVGAIPKDSIHKVVRENFAPIRQCYEQVLLANPGLEGRVIVKMTVGIDGAVTDAAATGVHPALETCVAEKIRKFRFPRPDSGASVEVTYPFMFKPA